MKSNLFLQKTGSIKDEVAPLPEFEELPTMGIACKDTISNYPLAIDNCDGAIVGVTNDPLTYTEEGTYIVTWSFIDEAGNETLQTQTFEVICETSSLATLDKVQLKIYPNPATSVINIETESEFNAKLMNTQGQIVIQETTEKTISVQHLPQGVYYLQIKTGTNEIHTEKIIIQ